MKKRNLLLTIFLGAGLTIGATSFAAHKSSIQNAPIEVEAEGEPNSEIQYIFSDDFNNKAFAGTYNCVLMRYSGTAHGLTNDNKSIYDSAVLSKVKLNGLPLTQFGGSMVQGWVGAKYFYIVYPAAQATEGAILEIEEGFAVGDAVFPGGEMYRLNASGKWYRIFNDSVNATYKSIMYYNNSALNDNFNQLLINYTGTPQTGSSITGESLHNFDQYITIDGQPFSSFAGSQLQRWASSEQTWMILVYPNTAVSEGSVLKISRGCKFFNVVFEEMMFKLNSSSEWEHLTSINNDELVVNGDYTMFTPSDYSLGPNDGAGYMYFCTSEGTIDAASDSFCFRVNANIADTSAYSVLSFGANNIYGSSPIVKVEMHYGTNCYLAFNNSVDYGASTFYTWETGKDYLVEVYFIKTSATAANVLLGINGELIWKSGSKDITGLTFGKNFTMTGTANTASYYSPVSTNTADALYRFGTRKLDALNVGFADNSNTGSCLTKYADAKSFYNAYLTKPQRVAFSQNAGYENLKNRFVAWGAANGESVSFNGSTGVLEAYKGFSILDSETNNTFAVVISVIAITSALAIAAFVLIKKRKSM